MGWEAERMQDDFNLKYLTSGDTSVSLKRKVFCAYHPNDFSALNEVFRDLSKVCDCTMFYYDSGNEPNNEEQLETELKSMNLFVLVVTTDFLFKPCFANKVVYEFALKHAIPVLPILFEGGLEEAFNVKIGNLQCLSKVLEKIDTTTVPYQEKLNNYLSQTLSADIDMKRCYDAFDASIFLSYRKKDRKYAQRLMELIHEEDACRNIAIWYDEFLVPGEDFNDSIKTELEDSSMFVLVVTPHIVEGDNYITLTEYPMATSLQKTVLPFEMQPTDSEKLKVFCPGIEETIETKNGENVRNVILNALNKLGVVQSENTAERTFLIGLAYLKGICVEKNREVGFSMITEAAEADVEEAVKTLVLLYKNGEGTSLDLDAATMWQKRLLTMCKKNHEIDACEQNAHTVLKTYLGLAEIQARNKNYEETHNTYYAAVEFCENEVVKNMHFAKRYAAMIYELDGKLWMQQGEYVKAQQVCFQESLLIREELYAVNPTIQSKLELIEVYELIGECYEQVDNTVGVKTQVICIKKLIPQAEEIDANVENYDLLKRFILCNNRLGHLYNVLNMWEEAFLCIGDSVLLAEKLSKISNTTDSKRQLLLAHINDGDQHARCNVENHYRTAFKAYHQAQLIAIPLLCESETLEIQLDAANIEEKMGYVLSKLNSNEEAIKFYENALAHFRKTHELAGTLPIKRKLYQCCFAASKVYQNSGNQDSALELLKESERINLDVLHMSPLAVLRAELADTLATLGEFYKAEWEIDEAYDYFKRSHKLLKDVWLRTGRVKDLKCYIGRSKDLIAVSKLACDFEMVNELTSEIKILYDKYHMFLN